MPQMEIIRCPHCRMRVLLKPDMTCPSCLASVDTSGVEVLPVMPTTDLDDREENRTKQDEQTQPKEDGDRNALTRLLGNCSFCWPNPLNSKYCCHRCGRDCCQIHAAWPVGNSESALCLCQDCRYCDKAKEDRKWERWFFPLVWLTFAPAFCLSMAISLAQLDGKAPHWLIQPIAIVVSLLVGGAAWILGIVGFELASALWERVPVGRSASGKPGRGRAGHSSSGDPPSSCKR